MQDNTLGHAVKDILIMLKALAILHKKWPSFSPNLNPIKTL
jgi:hypothetical protein